MLIDSEKLKELIKENMSKVNTLDIIEIAKPGIIGGLELALNDIEFLENESKQEDKNENIKNKWCQYQRYPFEKYKISEWESNYKKIGGVKMLKGTILDKYWDRGELKGLLLKRALAIIQQMEMWEGNVNDC